MIDECHRAVGQVKRIIESINANKVVGFTATPWSQELKSVFNGFIYKKIL